jgi:hypothetical protein
MRVNSGSVWGGTVGWRTRGAALRSLAPRQGPTRPPFGAAWPPLAAPGIRGLVFLTPRAGLARWPPSGALIVRPRSRPPDAGRRSRGRPHLRHGRRLLAAGAAHVVAGQLGQLRARLACACGPGVGERVTANQSCARTGKDARLLGWGGGMDCPGTSSPGCLCGGPTTAPKAPLLANPHPLPLLASLSSRSALVSSR